MHLDIHHVLQNVFSISVLIYHLCIDKMYLGRYSIKNTHCIFSFKL